MRYLDAHVHLADPDYQGQIDVLIQDARESGISRLLSNAVDYESSIETLKLAKLYEGEVVAAIGVHPWTITEKAESDSKLKKFEDLIESNEKYVKAIGEIGLDGKYTADESIREKQKQVFRFFLELAERKDLPVIVHSRLAVDEVLETLAAFARLKVLLHWYSGPVEKLREIKDRGYLISIGPSVCYSKRIIEIARHSGLDMLLSETDGPVRYHGPFESRQTRPSFVVDVVRKLSEIKALSPDLVRDAIWTNFRKLTVV